MPVFEGYSVSHVSTSITPDNIAYLWALVGVICASMISYVILK